MPARKTVAVKKAAMKRNVPTRQIPSQTPLARRAENLAAKERRKGKADAIKKQMEDHASQVSKVRQLEADCASVVEQHRLLKQELQQLSADHVVELHVAQTEIDNLRRALKKRPSWMSAAARQL